jgi:protein phosphatase
MTIAIPKLSLVVLIGPSGSGKSTFARKHFRTTEIVSSDSCRGQLSDDENDQSVTPKAFELLHYIVAKRLELGRLTVVDATNVQPEARGPLVEIARKYHCLPVAVILNLPEEICQERNRSRPDRSFGPHVIRNQRSQLRRSIRNLKREGFRQIFELQSQDDVDAAIVERIPMWNDRTAETGPFDLIGDVHGCADELEALLKQLGYVATEVPPEPGWSPLGYVHPAGRKAVFVGDLVDRGPRVVDTLSIVRNMVVAGSAICVPGNHDVKLLKKLQGRDVRITHGLAETLAEIDRIPEGDREAFMKSLGEFLDGLVSHFVLDGGKLVVAHAGLKAEMHGRGSAKVRDFALYGETTGEIDEFGLPVRHNWAAEYRGHAMVVYGHTPVPEPEWLNRTVNLDTGCVFGGRLTALRYPELEFVAVDAARMYYEPSRPFLPVATDLLSAQQANDTTLDIDDVRGKRIIQTQLRGAVTIREENATAALEVMSRFAANPKWLIYLPPTMSPCETSQEAGWLEHPAQAFAYFRTNGVPRVVCEEKHMGSRAVVVICRDADSARTRFGIDTGETGVVLTRTGRRFFNDDALEVAFLDRLREAITAAGTWDSLKTSWLCLDCELLPWSAKAQELLKSQYAAVGASGQAALPRANAVLEATKARLSGSESEKLARVSGTFAQREANLDAFFAAYRQYCWPVQGLADLKLAPFHLMASEGKVHTSQNHLWHMETLAAICRSDPEFLLATRHRVIDVTDPASEADGIAWWMEMTAKGGEGMVVKPLDFIVRGPRGPIQPAVKCRGREYLRIIYGPDYTTDDNLIRLRKRNLGSKRALAQGEFALGIEGLERFVRGEPLRRVHECAFGVLALESEPVDPRL